MDEIIEELEHPVLWHYSYIFMFDEKNGTVLGFLWSNYAVIKYISLLVTEPNRMQ